MQHLKFVLGLFGLLLGTAWAQPLVATSLAPYGSLLEQLVGDRARVVTLLPVGASPHTFSPTPRDVATLAEADLVVFNGGLDEWLLELVEASGNDAPVLEMLALLQFDPLGSSLHEDHGEEHAEDHVGEDHAGEEGHEEHGEAEHGDEDHADETHDEAPAEEGHEAQGDAHDHGGVNPHLWLDPLLMIQAVGILADALAELDPEGAAVYAANAEALRADLEALDAELAATLEPVRGAAFVPFHDAWPYFVRRYGLTLVVEIEPAPGLEPSARYLAEALEKIERSGARAIFSDVQLPRRPAEIVAEQAGLPLFVLDPEGGGLSETVNYQAMMRANARTIAEALGD